MRRISVWLWLALGGAVLQFVALGSNFYVVGGENVRDAWFGIPHASDLILASALLTVVLTGLAAADRSPVRGRTVGLFVGGVGLLATLQLAYRMAVPPFQGCLTYFDCGFTPRAAVTLLPGIWIGLVGCLAVTVGGFLHMPSSAARETRPHDWTTDRQEGMSPWLGLAALGAIGMFVFGFTVLPFYTMNYADGDSRAWSGWLSMPHTSSLVLAMTLGVLGLVWAAARRRSPLRPGALGGTIAVLGFVAGARILFRMIESPFHTGPAQGVFAQGGPVLHVWAFLSLISALVVVLAGIVQSTTHKEEKEQVAETRPRHA